MAKDTLNVTTYNSTASNTYTATANNANANVNATTTAVNTICWSDMINTPQLTIDPYINNSNWVWTH